jgi:hypothetical protein
MEHISAELLDAVDFLLCRPLSMSSQERAILTCSRIHQEAVIPAISVTMVILKEAGPEGLGRKNFEIWTQ